MGSTNQGAEFRAPKARVSSAEAGPSPAGLKWGGAPGLLRGHLIIFLPVRQFKFSFSFSPSPAPSTVLQTTSISPREVRLYTEIEQCQQLKLVYFIRTEHVNN